MAHGPAGSEMLRLDRPTQRSHHAEADGMGRFARRNEASSQLIAWGGVSRTADLGGPVHYVDFGGPAAAPRVVLVHGLGGSHLNWCLLAPRLVAKARLLAVDLVGFGLTHPEGRAADPGRQLHGRDGLDHGGGGQPGRGGRLGPDRPGAAARSWRAAGPAGGDHVPAVRRPWYRRAVSGPPPGRCYG